MHRRKNSNFNFTAGFYFILTNPPIYQYRGCLINWLTSVCIYEYIYILFIQYIPPKVLIRHIYANQPNYYIICYKIHGPSINQSSIHPTPARSLPIIVWPWKPSSDLFMTWWTPLFLFSVYRTYRIYNSVGANYTLCVKYIYIYTLWLKTLC